MMFRIKEVRTHNNPSIDEWVAYFLIAQFGEKHFELTHDCRIEFDTQTDVSDPHIEHRFRKHGVLFLGVGGGEFDEHPYHGRFKKERKEGECCATLVAKSLGVANDPALQFIIKLARNDDLGIWPQDEPGQVLGQFALPKMIKTMYMNGAIGYDRIYDLVFTMLSENYEEQYLFHSAAPVLKDSDWIKFRMPRRDKDYQMVLAHTDHPKIQEYAFAKTGIQLVIKVSTTGNWQIFTRRNSAIHEHLPNILGIIRAQEAKLRGVEVSKKDLIAEGSILGINFFKRAGLISNGTLTHEVEPSKLNPSELPNIIKKVLDIVGKRSDPTIATKPNNNVHVNEIIGNPTELDAMHQNNYVFVHQTIS